MKQELLSELLEQDKGLEKKELFYTQRLENVRSVRRAIAILLANDVVEDTGELTSIYSTTRTSPVLASKESRPRRGWTKIIREILSVHPGITFKEVLQYAREGGMEPEDVPDFEDRLKFALRDLTKKGFTLITKVDKKTPATYVLNPDK
jgi:predicted transcriptional regulator